ncbi:MAG: DUF2384 domain-containing protein [Acidimicrobiia bacterium]|nr:MAG: DUF2384 domain-containing protein [Acidimicrobiia bacterium]
MSERVLQGPFLTRAQAARLARIPAGLVAFRPDLLRVEGRWLQEAYFGFQFDRTGVRPELGAVVQELKREYSDIEIADWLVRPNQALGYSSPLKYLRTSGVERILAAAKSNGPTRERTAEVLGESDRGLPIHRPPSPTSATRPYRKRRATPRPAFGSR